MKMIDKELIKTLKKYVQQENCFTIEVRDILIDYKNSGGEQESAKKLIEELATEFVDNETLQDRVYDILDIVTGWCSGNMRVWNDENREN